MKIIITNLIGSLFIWILTILLTMRLNTFYYQLDLIKGGHFGSVYFMFYIIFINFIGMIIFGYFIQRCQINRKKNKIINQIIDDKKYSLKQMLNLDISEVGQFHNPNYDKNHNNQSNSFLQNYSNPFPEFIQYDDILQMDGSHDDNDDRTILNEKFL